MNRGIPHFKLPVGGTPAWELQDGGGDGKPSGLKSIADSCVILQSLRQSREKWISLTFPKFSSKARGGKAAADAIPPPHTIQTRGKCDVEIGPHIFHDTVFFVVHYLPPQPPPAPRPSYLYQPPASGANGSWQTTTPYGAMSYTPYGQHSPAEKYVPPVAAETTTAHKTSSPLLSSLTSSVSITPSLINQVNSAASSNPTLANLLQLAAAGKASPEQLKTLGLLIQSLASPSMEVPMPSHITQNSTPGSSSLPKSTASTSYSSAYGTCSPVKPFDLVIEFAESPSERWVFPRGHAICERLLDSTSIDAAYDILISTCVPFETSRSATDSMSAGPEQGDLSRQDSSPQLVTFRLKKAPLAVWDTVSRWAGGEEIMKQNRKILEDLKSPERVYLGHQLADGALRTQLQSSVAPSFSMKPIRPGQGNATRPRRKATPRKPVAGASDTPTTSPKRKRPSQAKITTALPQISCFTCGQTDVPLIMGGRFCRPCVDKGKGITVMPKPSLAPSFPSDGINNHYPAQISTVASSSQSTNVPQHQGSQPLPENR